MNKPENTYPRLQYSKIGFVFLDIWILVQRSLRHIFKNLDQLLSIIISPVMFMLLFRYVFGGAIETGGTTYVNYLVAGILVQTIAFGATTTSLSIANDLRQGIIERFKTLPIFSAGVLMGHVVADLVRNILSSIVMIGIALLVGFKPNANVIDWLQIAGVVLLFTFAFSWLSAIIGLLARSIEAVQWIGFVIVFPLTFASSAFVPTAGMPSGLRFFAENQPVTHVIEAIRALMIGTPVGNHFKMTIIWCVGFSIVSIIISNYLFKKYKAK